MTSLSDLTTLTVRLRAAPARLGPALDDAVARTAQAVQASAQAAAPVRTGYLRSSITTEHPAPGTAIVGPRAHYGGYVELGTSRMAARPYLFPAGRSAQAVFAREVQDAAGKALL